MKTYKQLMEKWLQTYHSDYFKNLSNIFINQSKKEFMELIKSDKYNEVRGFIVSDKKIYMWSNAVHNEIKNRVLKGKEQTKNIPIRIGKSSGSSIKIILSNNILRGNNDHINDLYHSKDIPVGDPNDELIKYISDIVKNNNQLKKLFSNFKVMDDRFQS